MKFYTSFNTYIDTTQPIDISLGLTNSDKNVKAWYVDAPRFEAVKEHGFNGSVADGGSVNFRNIFFNPHGHGTHTENLGHITKEVYSVNQSLKHYFFKAVLISIEPIERQNGEQLDKVITLAQMEKALSNMEQIDAVVVRTLPNAATKKSIDYSSTNPAYFEVEIVQLLDQLKVKHFLVDLPSVDRENDNGKLSFHHAFWQVPENPQFDKTISEMVFIANEVEDGEYILELQVAPFENDASPSRPILYKEKKD